MTLSPTPFASRAAAPGAPTFNVELVGARGAGKSTLAQYLASELRARSLLAEVTPAPDLRSKVARQLLTLGDRSRFLCSSLGWRPLSAHDLRTFRKRYRRLRIHAAIAARTSGVRLFDEGVFQLIMELQAKTAQKDIGRIARRVAALLPAPDLVILVDTAEDAIAQRRRLRGNRGDTLRPFVAPWERTALGHIRRLLAHLAQSGDGPELIVVDNDGHRSPHDEAANLADHLEMRVRGRPKTPPAVLAGD